jgi:hypothetical protein
MKRVSLNIPEDLYEQLSTAAAAAGQTVEQAIVAALRHGLESAGSTLTPPSSLSAALATLQATSTRDQYLDW